MKDPMCAHDKRDTDNLIPSPGQHRRSPYPTDRSAPPATLVDLAAQIEQADRQLATTTNAKLQVIAGQIAALQEEARRILEEARESRRLHRVECRLPKVVGRTYHLYEKEDGTLYFALLSPADWRGKPHHPYRGAYTLRDDYTWERIEPATDRQ